MDYQVTINNQVDDIIHLIMMLLDLKWIFRFGRCSHKFYKFVTDEKLWQVKLLAEYLIKPDGGMSALQSYKFCIYGGRKKSTGYDLFMINELKELKAKKVGTAQRMSM